jgi:hypothetical protein
LGPETFYFDGGNSNPGMPNPPGYIYGFKWEAPNEDLYPDEPDWLVMTFSFDSTKDPVWGDFYAKDGMDGDAWTYAYNIGFGEDPSDDFKNWIARPDGASVPEPGTMFLLGAGIIGIALFSRNKFKA